MVLCNYTSHSQLYAYFIRFLSDPNNKELKNQYLKGELSSEQIKNIMAGYTTADGKKTTWTRRSWIWKYIPFSREDRLADAVYNVLKTRQIILSFNQSAQPAQFDQMTIEEIDRKIKKLEFDSKTKDSEDSLPANQDSPLNPPQPSYPSSESVKPHHIFYQKQDEYDQIGDDFLNELEKIRDEDRISEILEILQDEGIEIREDQYRQMENVELIRQLQLIKINKSKQLQQQNEENLRKSEFWEKFRVNPFSAVTSIY